MTASAHLQAALRLLDQAGLSWRHEATASGFLGAGVDIQEGVLLISPEASVGNVLHEAGHLAILPQPVRQFVNTDLDKAVGLLMATIDWSNPDSPLCRAAIQCGDTEATAWAWAAGLAAGIPGPAVIRNEDYDGTGFEIREMLRTGAYMGIHGLQHAGLCAASDRWASHTRLPVYPRLARWTQPSFGLTTEELLRHRGRVDRLLGRPRMAA